MNAYVLGQIVQTGLLIALGGALVVIIGSSFHDMWLTKRLQFAHKKAKRRPRVTVIVYAQNSASVITACLTSIVKSSYRQYDIVVVNNCSTDTTKVLVADFKRKYQKVSVHIYNKRKNSGVMTALQQAYKKSNQGEIILYLRAEAQLPPTFLKEAVAHFQAIDGDRRRTVLHFNEYLPAPQGLVLLTGYFFQISRQLFGKVASHGQFRKATFKREAVQEKYAAMYSAQILLKKQQLALQNTVYDSRLPLPVFPVLSAKREFSWGQMYGLIGGVVVGYSIFMAASLQNSALLLIGWVLVVVWFLAAIWLDEAYGWMQKLRMSIIIPSLYFLFPVVFVVEMTIRVGRYAARCLRFLLHRVAAVYATYPAPLNDW